MGRRGCGHGGCGCGCGPNYCCDDCCNDCCCDDCCDDCCGCDCGNYCCIAVPCYPDKPCGGACYYNTRCRYKRYCC